MRWRSSIALLLLPLLPLVSSASYTVTVSNFSFTPSSLTLNPSDTVIWHWSSGTHSVVSEDGEVWCSVRTAPTMDCSRAFPTDGIFPYYCSVHPSLMRGTITVGTPASVTILSPSGGSTVSGIVPVQGKASHPSGIVSVVFRIDSGPWNTATLSGQGVEVNWSGTIDSNTLSNGPHTLVAKVTASSNATGRASVSFSVQNPKATVTISSPSGGSTVSGTVLLKGNASHPFNPIRSVRWWVDSGAPKPATLLGSGTSVGWEASWETLSAPIPNGFHTIYVQATTDYPLQTSPTASVGVYLQNPPRYEFYPSNVQGTTGTISGSMLQATVTNGGNVGVSIPVLFEYLYKGTWKEIGRTTVFVPAFGSALAQRTWSDPFLLGRFTIQATVDPDNLYAESNESNNSAQGTASFWTSSLDGIDLRNP